MAVLSDDLSWFLILAESEHIGEAAAELRMPQSTLSRWLGRLERRLGTTLFDRHGRSLALNTRGAALGRRLRAAVTQLDLGESEVRRLLDPETGLVRFDFMHSLGTWLAPRLIHGFVDDHPRADIHLHQGTGRDLIARIRDDEADVALCSPRPDHDDLRWLEVLRQPLALCLPSDHRLARLSRIRLADVAAEPFISTPGGFNSRDLLEEVAADEGVEVNVAFESDELSTVAGLVVSGVGVALLPADDPYLQLPGTVFIPLATSRSREVGLIWRAGQEPASTPGLFLDSARAVLSSGR
ncbi:HTH-type transcriptional regulator GltC [Acidipropionibacterium virtanenii]|uniref:HTH-type transcriptional regulator GltC n=1 Tax=Acidipropionibacterium virtanenii TaxID=2057246 RepID=A0A344UX14_9ACTN|nr:HTH-type transcriptional regulator GltC [Acidipropionibacterium virtanenii]